MEYLLIAAVVLLWLFGLVGMLDGMIFHTGLHRLHAHAETRGEHRIHMVLAGGFIPVAYLVYVVNTGGALLWLAVAAVALHYAIETWDLFVEKASRAKLGGLPSGEYWFHALMNSFCTASLTLMAAAKPPAAWRLDAPLVLEPDYPWYVTATGWAFLAVGVVTVFMHLALLHPRFAHWPAPAGRR